MRAKVCASAVLVLLLALAAAGQTQDGFLDVYIAKVKPEKRAEFDALIKRMAEANRKAKGDTWIASEVAYGEHNTIYFTSRRGNYAEIEQHMDLFTGALNKAFGPAGADKLLRDFNACLVSSRGELRRRRMDLSWNAPSDPAALNKLIGESRWVRTMMVRVRPGRVAQYEALLKSMKEGFEKAGSGPATFVSQAAAGHQGSVFYLSTLRSSLESFDKPGPGLRQALGEGGYREYTQTSQEAVLSTETLLGRYTPELSNPPEEIAAVAPNYWRPKPAAAARPQAKPEQPAATKQ